MLVLSYTNAGNYGPADTAIRACKPRESVYKLADGRGLQLHIACQCQKLLRFTYRFDGK
jgi:hypothetical protein